MKTKNDRKQLTIKSNSINSNSNLFQDLSAKESELISGGMKFRDPGWTSVAYLLYYLRQ